MKNKNTLIAISITLCILIVAGIAIFMNCSKVKITKLDKVPEGTWQSEVNFPDWKGYINSTLALNSMYSFDGYKDQGKLYFTINKDVESFDLFVNNTQINTKKMLDGVYEVDYSKIAINGTNTIQVSNITPSNLEKAITVNIPYPIVTDGNLKDVRTS